MTKKYRKLKNLFFWLSTLCWLGLCGFLIIYGLSTGFILSNDVTEETVSYGQQIVNIFMPLVVTYGIALLLVVFVREKARNTVWLVNIVLSASILGNVFMYIVIGMFALDEFIFVPLHKHYKNKYSINKEIDKRL